jgi:predicted PurR-regulated permease PerM
MTPAVKALFWAGALLFFALFMWLFNNILTPFILGIAIAYLLDPLLRRFSTQERIPRWAGALIILVLFLLFLTALFVLIAPMAFRQGQMLIEQIPNYAQNIMDYLSPYLTWIQDRMGTDYMEQIKSSLKDNTDKLVGVTGGIVGGIASGGAALISFGTTLVLTPLVAFFMMKEWPKIVSWVQGLYPREHATVIKGLMSEIDTKVSGFIRGQITVAFILSLLYAISLSIAGLNYGFLIGLGAGLFSIIPLVGSTLGLVVSVLVAWFQTGDMVYTGIIAAIFIAGQFVEGNFLTPMLVGDSVGLHPLWIMFALLAGGSLMGIVGMLLAVPVAAVIGVLMSFAIKKYKASSLYQKDGEAAVIIVENKHDQ